MLSLPNVLAGIIFIALTAYVLFGGADFGGGVWDLLAAGPRKDQQRRLVAHAIGPVWEANHVWLIFAIVLLFTCFPTGFARVAIVLHVPLTLMLIGIVLRGSAFVFQTYGGGGGRVFATASLVTPVLLGICVGAVASGAVGNAGRGTGEGFYAGYIAPWLTPFALAVGVFALACFAFLAAVYLTLEAEELELREDFRHRAFIAAGAVLVLAVVGWALFRHTLPLNHRVIALTGAAALGTFWSLWRPPVPRRAHCCRGRSGADRDRLGSGAVSLSLAARSHHRGVCGATGHAGAGPQRRDRGRGGALSVALLFDEDLQGSGHSKNAIRCATHHAASAPAIKPSTPPNGPKSLLHRAPAKVPTTKLTSALSSFIHPPGCAVRQPIPYP